MYNLPATTGSSTSFSAPGGPRTISAAAFRRQQQQMRNYSSESVGLADVSPLNVKKRPLPASPSGNTAPGALRQSIPRVPSAPLGNRGSLDASDGSGRFRSVSAAQPPGDRSSRAGLEGASDDDYDYISANTGQEGRDTPSGYEHGKYATNLEQNGGLR